MKKTYLIIVMLVGTLTMIWGNERAKWGGLALLLQSGFLLMLLK